MSQLSLCRAVNITECPQYLFGFFMLIWWTHFIFLYVGFVFVRFLWHTLSPSASRTKNFVILPKFYSVYIQKEQKLNIYVAYKRNVITVIFRWFKLCHAYVYKKSRDLFHRPPTDGSTWMRALCLGRGNVATQYAEGRCCVNIGSCTTQVFVTMYAFTFAISAWTWNWSREQT